MGSLCVLEENERYTKLSLTWKALFSLVDTFPKEKDVEKEREELPLHEDIASGSEGNLIEVN